MTQNKHTRPVLYRSVGVRRQGCGDEYQDSQRIVYNGWPSAQEALSTWRSQHAGDPSVTWLENGYIKATPVDSDPGTLKGQCNELIRLCRVTIVDEIVYA